MLEELTFMMLQFIDETIFDMGYGCLLFAFNFKCCIRPECFY